MRNRRPAAVLSRRQFAKASVLGAVAAASAPGRGRAGPPAALPAAVGDACSVGDRRHLFLDDRLVDLALTRGVTRTLNPPADIRRILAPERPWESLGFIFYSTVLEDGDEIRLYYGSYGWDGRIVRNFCLATSRDGVRFERARLGRKRIAGQDYETNLLSPTAIETGVFLDPHAPPEKRYRMIFSAGGIECPDAGGVYSAASADGIHWEKNPVRLLPFIPDSQHTAYWDESLQRYVIYLRAWNRDLRKREVCRLAVDDLDTPWPHDTTVAPYLIWGKGKTPTLSREFPIVMAADDRDPPNLDIYTNVVTPYPHAAGALLAFPAVYLKFAGPDWAARALSGNDGTFEVQFASSRDGIAWERHRQPYVAAGHHDGLDLRLVSMARGMVRRGRWLYQYFIGWPHTHGRPNVWDRDPANGEAWTRMDKGGIYLARQRLDGFTSMDGAYTGGVLTTRPLTFEGDRLRLNLDTRGAGSARVALLDPAGAPLAGFSAAECEILNADDTDFEVRWKGGADVGAWAGRPVRVQVEMRNTKLYALQFARAGAEG